MVMEEEKKEKEPEKTAEVEEAAKPEGESGAEAATPQDSGAESEAKTETPAEEEKPADPEKPAEPDWKALYALTLADFDNYKKRAARDREDTYRYAEMDILKDILPVVDNLSLALANAKAGDVVIIAGKGHETTQEIKGVKHPFDDREVVRDWTAG